MMKQLALVALLALIGCPPPKEGGGPQATPGGAALGSADRKPEPLPCPAGFSSEQTEKAVSDCRAQAGVNVISQKGEAAALCVNEAGRTYKCIAPMSFDQMCRHGVDYVKVDEVKCYQPAAVATTTPTATATATTTGTPSATQAPPPPPTKEEICSRSKINNCDQDRACHDACGDNHGCNEGCSGMANHSKANGCWSGPAKC